MVKKTINWVNKNFFEKRLTIRADSDIIKEMNVGKDAFLRNEEGVFSFITYSW